ncbi:MAG: DNA gyrase subunit A [Ruminococcaceae bacterium]|nr:DNA gyrase subunit A [Oscillospiraceae bacterium]
MNYEFPNQKIVDIEIDREVKKSFIDYSMSVIMSRALPDVRDGLKPVHRRILYAMYEDHLTYDKPFRKSATTVGNVLGRYHPHGDTAVYDTMVRLAQPFSMRYILVQGQGNFGSIDGDGAAAYRYTEARMARLADSLLVDIEKDIVDFVPNFDNSRQEPSVLPARFPNLLVNGSVGIAVGMATNIPPHNLGEVIDGTIFVMENPDCSVSEIMQYIKGPDFPTAATIYGTSGIIEAYTTGRGKITVRAKAEIDEDNYRIIVSEIPYQVNKSTLVGSIYDLIKEKRIEGLMEVRDESGRDGMRIVLEYRHDANAQVILNKLYKYTQLQDTFAANMVALVDNVPQVLGIKPILEAYIKHQEDVIVRRTNFDLKKARHELHINEGYSRAIDHIDEIIKTIRASDSVADAKVNLVEKFEFSELQAQAIVEMTLGRLSGLERQKINDRIAQLTEKIGELEAILADENKVKEVIKEELLAIKDRFNDERRTEIVEAEDDIDIEDLIERHTCVITMTNSGYIKRQRSDVYSAQRRGGKGIIGMTTKEEDFVENVIACNSHSYLLIFTSNGKVHMRKAYRIPEAGRTAKGTNIVNILELADNEKITSIISVGGFFENEYLTMITRNGVIKRTNLSAFEYQRKGGKIAIDLDEGDELLYVKHTDGNRNIILATHDGMAVRFDENDVRVMGRTARGVRGIRLSEGDYVAGATIVEDDKTLITITENGFGKKCDFDNYTCHNRGGKGVTCHNITEKTGKLAGIMAVEENDDLLMITNEGTMIRIPVQGIPVYSRTASGVIVMRLDEGAKVVNFTKVSKDEDDVEEASDTEGAEEISE